MHDYHPISHERHAALRWRRHGSYSFAAYDAVVPLVGAEFSKAVLSLPIALIEQAEAYLPVAVLGIQPGINLFVAPDGRWTQSYIPAFYRGYPFRLAHSADGQLVLCFDEASGLLAEDQGESFFDAEGKPTPAVQGIVDFLSQIEHHRVVTSHACAVLKAHELIAPWPVQVQGASGVQVVDGLFRIDEAALNRLPADALASVRDSGALVLAYTQLLSMQHLQRLGQLAQAYVPPAPATPPAPILTSELNFGLLNRNDTLNFSNLR